MLKKSARLEAIKPHFPLLMALTGSAMIGLSPIFVRMTDIGPNATGCYRLLFALPLMYLWMNLEGRVNPASHIKPKKKEWWWFILAGFFFSLDLAAWHLSIDMTTIVNAAIFNNLTPIFVPLFLWALFSERPTSIYLASALLAIVGSAILTGSTLTLDSDNFQGDMLAIFAAVAYSGYIVVLKNLRGKFNTPTVMFWSSFSSLIFLAIFTYIMGEDYTLSTPNDWIGAVGLAILVHILGQGLLAYSIGQLSAGFVSVTMLLGPVVSAIMGWVVFGEALFWLQTLGGIVVLSSIATARIDDRKAREKSKK